MIRSQISLTIESSLPNDTITLDEYRRARQPEFPRRNKRLCLILPFKLRRREPGRVAERRLGRLAGHERQASETSKAVVGGSSSPPTPIDTAGSTNAGASSALGSRPTSSGPVPPPSLGAGTPAHDAPLPAHGQLFDGPEAA